MTDMLENMLSEQAMENLEASIAQTAAGATYAAYVRALAAGRTVVRVEGSEIVASSAEGILHVVTKAKPRRKVSMGQVIKVRRIDPVA